MFTVRLAELNIGIDNRFPFVERQCAGYISELPPDFAVSVGKDDIEKERSMSEDSFSDGYLESICLYRAIAMELPRYDAFLMHCSAVETGGRCYAFAAKSGTGKTTHTKLWRRMLGDSLRVINGDKPIMRFIDGRLCACGTPWAGKEMLNTNAVSPLAGICFLFQSPDNTIKRLSPSEALQRTANQIIIPRDAYGAARTLDLVSKMLTEIPAWLLGCNISQEAAKLSYETMTTDRSEVT